MRNDLHAEDERDLGVSKFEMPYLDCCDWVLDLDERLHASDSEAFEHGRVYFPAPRHEGTMARAGLLRWLMTLTLAVAAAQVPGLVHCLRQR